VKKRKLPVLPRTEVAKKNIRKERLKSHPSDPVQKPNNGGTSVVGKSERNNRNEKERGRSRGKKPGRMSTDKQNAEN